MHSKPVNNELSGRCLPFLPRAQHRMLPNILPHCSYASRDLQTDATQVPFTFRRQDAARKLARPPPYIGRQDCPRVLSKLSFVGFACFSLRPCPRSSEGDATVWFSQVFTLQGSLRFCHVCLCYALSFSMSGPFLRVPIVSSYTCAHPVLDLKTLLQSRRQ